MIVYDSLKQVKAISFDLDDTLYDNVPIIERAEKWYEQTLLNHPYFLNKKLPSHQDIKVDLVKNNHAVADDVTECRKLILLRRFILAGLCPMDAELNAELVMRDFINIRSQLTVPKLSLDILSKLKSKYPLIAVTNGNVDLKKIGLEPYFDVYLRADSVLRAKPAPGMFLAAANKLGISPKNIIHIGDDPVTDVIGAKTAGCMSCMFSGIYNPNKPIYPVKVLPNIEIFSLTELEFFL